jgi:hypothetical protein
MSDEICYELPLAPTDLVAIYKNKENIENFTLWVDYVKSKEKLTAKHIIIYLANTNFKTSFAQVDEELIIEYIKSDFMVDCPLLTRILCLIIKHYYGHEVTEQEQQLYPLFGPDQIADFIKHQDVLLKELVETIGSIIPFAMRKLWDGLTPESQAINNDLKEFIDMLEVKDAPCNCGPNIARLVTTGYDAFMVVVSNSNLRVDYNTQLFNDKPKYFGKDLYHILCETNITSHIINLFPKGFLLDDNTA